MEIRCAAFSLMSSGTTSDTTPDTPPAPASGVKTCPKCGIEAPGAPECRRCGVLVDLYRGPALGAAALRPTASAAPATPPPAAPLPPPLPFAAPTFGSEPLARFPPVDRFAETFGVGDILSQTFSVFFANFVPFCLLAALALLPLFVYRGALLALLIAPSGLTRWSAYALTGLCSNLGTAAITYGVMQQMWGVETTVGDCVRRGASSLLPVLGLVVVQGIAVWAGLLVCLVPGIVLSLQWEVSIPVAVAEGKGIGEAMSRSSFLTEGLRGDIFGVRFVIFVLELGFFALLGLVRPSGPVPALAVVGAGQILMVGLTATSAAVIYHRLRSLKEGFDTEGVADVFA
jgi:hypothetical protein